MSKFSPKNMQAIILRLISEPFLIEKFHDSLHPEDFSQGQQDVRKQALGKLVEVLLGYYREKAIDRLNVASFEARLNSYADSEINNEARSLFAELASDVEVQELSQNDGILEVFLELLQRNMTIRWYGEFRRMFSTQNTRAAIENGREFFERVDQVKIKDEAEFDYREVDSLFEENAVNPNLCLPIGLPDIDLALGHGLEPSTLNLFVAPPGGGKPIWEETLVTLGSGQRTPLKNIKVGDTVIGGRSGLPKKVLAVYEQGLLPCLRIRTASGRTLFAAPDHPCLTPEGWVDAGYLEPRMSMALLSHHEIRAKETRLDSEFRMAGYFTGDGNCTQSNAIITCFDPVQKKEIYRHAESLGWRMNEKKQGKVEFSNGVRAWLREVGMAGTDSYSKRVPKFVREGTKHQIAQFLAAYFECDGSVFRKEVSRLDVSVEYYSVSKDLLEDIQHLLQLFGINSNLASKKGKYKGDTHLSWRLSLATRNDVARFRSFIPVIGKKLPILHSALAFRNSFDTMYIADEIMEVEPVDPLPCRCITVEDDACFVASGFVVHNSQCCSHLVQVCVRMRRYAHVTLVEDRKKTFLPRVISGLCHIPIGRLKKEFHSLSAEERTRFDNAVAQLRKYIKLDFLYDSNISEIHRRKLEYRRYCKLHGLPVPTVDILDYTGHVACTAQGDKTHDKYLAAYTVRKNYCLKNECIGIDFGQVNRQGSQKMSGDDIITKNDLASAFDIARVADTIITINRNDDQKQKCKAIWYVAKLRDAGDIDGAKFEVGTDFDYGRYDLASAVNLSKISSSIK